MSSSNQLHSASMAPPTALCTIAHNRTIVSLLTCSLYVTLELVKLVQCMYLSWDRQMYDAASDTPFVYKTTTLNEVWRIDYRERKMPAP